MIAIGIIPGSDIMNCMENATSKPRHDTHTTHWSVQYSVHMGTNYMGIKVVLEYNVKDLQIATTLDKFKGW